MFDTLFRKTALVNLELADQSELGALAEAAKQAAKAFKLDETALHASMLASEAQGAQFAGEQAVIVYASSDTLKAPRTLLVTLAKPVAWGSGEGAHAVSQLVILAMPGDHSDEEKQAVLTRIRRKLDAGVPSAAEQVEQFARTLLAE